MTAGLRIGIDLGGTKIEIAVLDSDGGERLRRRVPTPTGDYDATVATIARLALEAERDLGERCPVGIGIPGTISPATGLVKNANSTVLIGKPLRQDVERALGRPICIANDADCFALSEATDGAATHARIVFGVILGTGVGGGIVVDGKLVTGPSGIGGEWGHNPLPWPNRDELPGRACYCGKHGCIETWVSGPGFARDASVGRASAFADARAVVTACEHDDGDAREALARYVDRVSRSLASVVNILDPHVIVLGGGMSNVPELCERIAAALPAYVFTDVLAVRLLPPLHGDSSGVRGAARLTS